MSRTKVNDIIAILSCTANISTAQNTVSKSPTIFPVCIKKNFRNPVQKRALTFLGVGVSPLLLSTLGNTLKDLHHFAFSSIHSGELK